MPVFELQAVDPDVDFPALARCTIEAYESPPQNVLHILFPIHDSTDGNANHHEAREAAIAEAGDRLRHWHTHEPTSHWLKVVDVETGGLAGGASWNIFKTNPFADPFGHELEVTWFPNDDGATRFVEKALENYAMPRYEVAQRPHLCMSLSFDLKKFFPSSCFLTLVFPPTGNCQYLPYTLRDMHTETLQRSLERLYTP